MKIVAVTSCPSGVAHTYLAAESLIVAAQKQGFEIHVETQGSVGTENELTAEQIKATDVVILTNDTGIQHEERFTGKPAIRISCGDCINKADIIMKKIQEKMSKKIS